MIFRGLLVASSVAISLVYADGTGVPPRDSGSQYQAHGETNSAIIAASIVPPKQAAKLLTSDVTKRYIVMEVAVYPKSGHEIEIQSLDFALKRASGGTSRPANPEEVASVWGQARPELGRRPPTQGAPYEVFGLSKYNSGPDPRALETKLQRLALPKGRTNRAVAGYVYFPVPVGGTNKVAGLEYSAPRVGAVNLIFGH
ncbi:MAG: hypothetical protein QOJ99_2316 [Bryobacterales bacterium]|jgi:hypothetical protein|nr:hypothetical protein [Bryobacterales bacterium]